MTDRLDRIEAILAQVAEQQAQHRTEQIQWNREFDERLEQSRRESNERMDLFQAEMERSRREADERMTRVEQAQLAFSERMERVEVELDENFQYIGTELGRLTSGLEQLRQQFALSIQQAEQDRNQAAIDRAEFRSTVEQLLQVLTQRFTSNGGS